MIYKDYNTMTYMKEIASQVTFEIAFAHITFFVAQIDFYCYGYSSISV